MRIIFFTLLLMMGSISMVQAQGTLQFNQVKLVTASETVPAGKVWKLESVMSPEQRYPTSGTTFPSYSRSILVNGNSVTIREEFVNGLALGFNGCCGGGFWMNNTGQSTNSNPTHLVRVASDNTKLPLWLPAGTTLAPVAPVNGMSVIEFNVIP
jgi:hypothetical protein